MSEGNDSPTARTAGAGNSGDDRDTVAVSCTDSFGELTFHPETGTYRTRFDASLDVPSIAVVSAVAAVAGVAITELAPLHRTIDPDALDSLWGAGGGNGQGDAYVRFRFADHDVTLARHGLLSITPPSGDGGSRAN